MYTDKDSSLISDLGSLIVYFSPPNWDEQSARCLVNPGIYHRVKWYGNVIIRIFCNLGVAWLVFLDKIASKHF